MQAQDNIEILRQMLMNVFLFVPVGAALAVIYQKNKHKMRFIILFALSLSLIIETTQFIFQIGYAEFDDIICNSIGTILGSSSSIIADKIRIKHINRNGSE